MMALQIIFMSLGAFFVLLAGLGLYRMPDFYSRLQASSKASTAGIIFILLGVNAHEPSNEGILKSVAIILALLLTTPLATQSLAKGALTTENKRSK